MSYVTAAIIQNPETGRILICQKQPHGLHASCWEFPCGRTRENESVEDCLKRVCMDQLNLRPDQISLFSTVPYNGEINYFYLCPMPLNELVYMVDREHASIAWVSQEEMKNYHFCPADAAMLEKSDVKSIFEN